MTITSNPSNPIANVRRQVVVDPAGASALKVVGYWAGPGMRVKADPNTLPVSNAVDTSLLSALETSSYLYESYRGFSLCRICQAMNGSTELTNGHALYPAGLGHYLAVHRIVLPVEVRELLLASPKPLAAESVPADLDWWNNLFS